MTSQQNNVTQLHFPNAVYELRLCSKLKDRHSWEIVFINNGDSELYTVDRRYFNAPRKARILLLGFFLKYMKFYYPKFSGEETTDQKILQFPPTKISFPREKKYMSFTTKYLDLCKFPLNSSAFSLTL